MEDVQQTMRIRLFTARVGHLIDDRPGDVITVPVTVAQRYIAGRMAEPVKQHKQRKRGTKA